MKPAPVKEKKKKKKNTSPKWKFAEEYLRNNPEEMKRSGGELSKSVIMDNGKTLSRRYWNQVKKEIKNDR